MGLAEVNKQVGEPTESFRIWNQYRWGKLSADFAGEPEWVKRLATSDSRDQTPEGLHPGSTEFEMRAKLGSPPRTIDRTDHSITDGRGRSIPVYEYCYPSGVAFFFSDSSNVSAIWVTQPGHCSDE